MHAGCIEHIHQATPPAVEAPGCAVSGSKCGPDVGGGRWKLLNQAEEGGRLAALSACWRQRQAQSEARADARVGGAGGGGADAHGVGGAGHARLEATSDPRGRDQHKRGHRRRIQGAPRATTRAYVRGGRPARRQAGLAARRQRGSAAARRVQASMHACMHACVCPLPAPRAAPTS